MIIDHCAVLKRQLEPLWRHFFRSYSLSINLFRPMPGSCSYFLIAIITSQDFFWVFQFTGRTIIEKIVINPARRRLLSFVFIYLYSHRSSYHFVIILQVRLLVLCNVTRLLVFLNASSKCFIEIIKGIFLSSVLELLFCTESA